MTYSERAIFLPLTCFVFMGKHIFFFLYTVFIELTTCEFLLSYNLNQAISCNQMCTNLMQSKQELYIVINQTKNYL